METRFLYNPRGFDPKEFLVPDLHRHAESARYMIHRIHIGQCYGLSDSRGFVPMNADETRRMFRHPNAYKATRDALVDRGVLECDGRYIKGEKSMGYRIGLGLSGRRFQRVLVSDSKLIKKLAKERAEAHADAKLEAVHGFLWECLTQLEIDYPAALDALLEAPHEPTDETAIQLIRDRQWFFHVCDYGRVHTNLTSLKSSMRRFLTKRGARLVNLDIRNSQPFMFAATLLADEYRGKTIPADVALYTDLVQAGQFYDHLMKPLGIPPESRSEFKKKLFAELFYCEPEPEREMARLFGVDFPNVYRTILEAKAEDYRSLAHRMQRAESGVMIQGVAARVMREMPGAWIATIHDSVVTTQDRADAIKKLMLDEFSKVGFKPTINLEPLYL